MAQARRLRPKRNRQDQGRHPSKRESLKAIEVQLIREDDRKLAGFVKLEVEALAELKSLGGFFEGPITKECMASMDENWHVAEHDFY
ncbi:hypothetical protein [Bradyrhizobium lablabi]|uniref:hypothetical protein n=1 Tax=Bradyrhizobium lablabi TaxID=722472 RepID=UPI000A5C3803|nr:hypothetical protein [Bradyrhizobium lablabi]